MGLILLPLSWSSQITACFFSPTLCPPSSLPASLHPFLSMMVSFSNQTAGLLSAWWLYALGGVLLLSLSLPPSISSLLSPLHCPPSSSLCPHHFFFLSFFSLLCHLFPLLPPSVTTALEEMSFHGRFAAISKMAALPNGQLPWF